MFKIGDKVVPNEFEFDFDNNFYILKLDGGETFIASYKDEDGDIWGLSGNDEGDICTYLNTVIKKIIASIPKR